MAAVGRNLGVVLGAAYLLLALLQRVMFGNITNPLNEHLPDLNGREWATLLPLVFPARILDRHLPRAAVSTCWKRRWHRLMTNGGILAISRRPFRAALQLDAPLPPPMRRSSSSPANTCA